MQSLLDDYELDTGVSFTLIRPAADALSLTWETAFELHDPYSLKTSGAKRRHRSSTQARPSSERRRRRTRHSLLRAARALTASAISRRRR